MTWALAIRNDYPPNWPELNARAKEEAGHRCIRCGHPYRKGAHGSGEWSPCDEKCTHTDGTTLPNVTEDQIVSRWRILTVHHADGDKANCRWWNLLALCQRCHLRIQGRVNPETPYFLEHSDWYKPYVGGFYAFKYERRELTREQVAGELDRLLTLERLA